ncbi:ferrochelatase [Humitalea sp. 24SJ18S-53]|uniref:ferrochelatase n=1 Tax=Humitalea sp. 24SJ18S-53 TaxID=3422307 RepID=UPI003D665475
MAHAPLMDAAPPPTDPQDRQRRVAVVLLNLGGPDSPAAVRPFLTNLFRDPAILRVPGIVRPFLGWVIAALRTKAATANYAILGGKSPLLELTRDQAAALEAALRPEVDARCFVAMRYWHPFAAETLRDVMAWAPDEVLLLPLYPQFSTTTTGSSMDDWADACRRQGFAVPTTTVCCWHSDPGFAAATARLVQDTYTRARADLPADVPLRVLFSAHGLPESIVAAGDPYQWQVEQTVAAVVSHLHIEGLDHIVCYQSRATPQKWITPSTEAEIERAALEKTAVLICPIAFVSEHSETLVELDIEYREKADHVGVPGYFRVPAQNSDAGFIAALAGIVHRAMAGGRSLCSFAGPRQCPKAHGDCPHARAGKGGRPALRISEAASA